MIREFFVVELMLPNASGEVRGRFEFNDWNGTVGEVTCEEFDFWDSSDQPISLAPAQQRQVTRMIRFLLEADRDLAEDVDVPINLSAARLSPDAVTEAEKTLALYLATVRQQALGDKKPAATFARRLG